ncbi:MAG: 16S rRNA (uracil(1498)-N(3))-methyltransferase [Gammaproteobacteria bacterium]|nr:16S rRNA (uracil(1498)-N(3))-methyltransferase [Gammaproteobacteria bacterium]
MARLTEPLFYNATLTNAGDITLTDDEAHHVTVQRLRVGDAIALFDGRGLVVRGVIAAINRHEVRISAREYHRETLSVPSVELCSAVPKGDRLTTLLDMATQLGMAHFTPVRWQRSVTDPKPDSRARWQRLCLEACKQSRRLFVPAIDTTIDLTAAAKRAQETGALLVVAHPTTEAMPLHQLDIGGAERVSLFIGPEGGVTESEVKILQAHGARFVHLGPAILRIETAATAMLAWISGIKNV